MAGIKGLFAKRKQAASSSAQQEQQKPSTTPTDDAAPVVDEDPFSSFDERPSTAGSYGFSSFNDMGSYDNFDNGDEDVMEEEQQAEAESSPATEDAAAAAQGNFTGGLSMFKRRDMKEASSATNATTTLSPADKTTEASILPVPTSIAVASDVEMSVMPPPPPRAASLSPPAHSVSPSSMPQYQPLEADMITNDPPQDVEGIIDSRPAAQDLESMVSIGLETLCAGIDSFAHEEKHTTPSGPTLVLKTPAKTSTSTAPAVTGASATSTGFGFLPPVSLESPLPAVTPPAHQQQKFTIETPALRTTDFANVTPDQAQQHYEDDGVEEEGFDDMHVGFLHDLQAVKDKHLLSEEQMLEMEVYLDRVIATMDADIMLMQELQDELDEIDASQDEILVLHRSR